jgi:hypothetical protein
MLPLRIANALYRNQPLGEALDIAMEPILFAFRYARGAH